MNLIDDNQHKNLESIQKLLFISWIILIIYSLSIYISYFECFGISIISYLSITEIPFIFFFDYQYALSIGLMLLLKFDYQKYRTKANNKKFINRINILFFTVILIFVIIFSNHLLPIIIFSTILIIAFSFLLSNKDDSVFKIYSIITFLLAASMIYGLILSEFHKNFNPSYGDIILKKNGDTIQFNNTLIKLMPTKDYIITYDILSKQSIVIMKSDIESYIYKKYIIYGDTVIYRNSVLRNFIIE